MNRVREQLLTHTEENHPENASLTRVIHSPDEGRGPHDVRSVSVLPDTAARVLQVLRVAELVEKGVEVGGPVAAVRGEGA